LQSRRAMRLLLPLLCLMSSSSCLFLHLGGIAAWAAGERAAHQKKGAAEEARIRAEHAREAAVIRARYNELHRDVPAPESLQPSAPPLVQYEPVRVPLRPR
jgi:hypothetical protein